VRIINTLMMLLGYSIVLLFIATAISETVRIKLVEQFHKRKGLYKTRRGHV